MKCRKALIKTANSFPGGMDVLSLALGMGEKGLKNRIYEQKQKLSYKDARLMQEMTKTSHIVEEFAISSGGVFVKVPKIDDVPNEELLKRFNKLYAHIGELSSKFNEYVINDDEELSDDEKETLESVANDIHVSTQTLLALIVKIYHRA